MRKLCSEAVGTALLLAAVVGSGIMGDRLAQGNVAIALLANTVATGAMLAALILTFGPVSGAHFNPAVTLADAALGGLSWREVPGYIAAQLGGALLGVACAHVMFELPVYSLSQHARSGFAQAFSEFVATFGLMSVIWGCSRFRSSSIAASARNSSPISYRVPGAVAPAALPPPPSSAAHPGVLRSSPSATW